MDYIPLNFAIMGHPLNWLTIWLMLVIAGFALQSLFDLFNTSSAPNSQENS